MKDAIVFTVLIYCRYDIFKNTTGVNFLAFRFEM